MLLAKASRCTSEQSLEPQLQALQAVGVEPERIYTDVASGARTERHWMRR